MAKHVILEAYSFNASTRTITINGRTVRREQLVLITNVTTNTVIYNFADSSLTASSYTTSQTNNVETTVIVLTYNTGSMSNSDKLSIIVDETNETMYPAEVMMDANQKFKVSTPQSLIDTDFEFGTQPTKWETISLLNNRPSAFYDPTAAITLTAISGAGTRVVTLNWSGTPSVAPSTSTPIFVQDSTDPSANGWYLPATVGSGTLTYIARGNVTNGNIFDATKTLVFIGVFYTGAGITVGTGSGAAFTNVGTLVTCTTTFHHGLSVGDAVYVVGTTAATSNPPNGSWFVRTTPTSNTFTFEVVTAPVGAITAAAGAQLSLFARPWGNAIHRPFDGGVYFTAGAPYHGNQLIRQTRRYFRYQSGKGMQFSTGSCMTSPFVLDSLTASGTTVTVTTKFPHNLFTDAVVRVSGADQTAYNGTFTVTGVPTELTFTYTAGGSPTATPATGTSITVQPFTWFGAFIRLGMFDNQNGFFWEYDGQGINVVRRSSTFQLAGYISTLAANGQICTGINTQWALQLSPGDFIVIRGMSHTVVSIESNTSMTIYPEYRGTAIAAPTQCIISRTDNLRIPQSSFNIDRLDGTGASGFNLDITKIQMWMLDYSWYGAGAIRFGVKNARGEFIFAHRIAHANSLTEAFMRSGNMPARYEVNTIAPFTKITGTVSNTETTSINVVTTAGFPPAGILVVTQSGNTGAAIEYISYTGRTATSFTGLTRARTNLTGPLGLTGGGGNAAAQTFTFSATAPVGVTYFSPQCSNTISHWGSSVIMDGRYDDDKSILFNYGMVSPITYATAGQRYPVFSIRLGPTVDSGIVGILGARELINRMQLQPVGIGTFTTTAAVRVELWLNARVSGGTFVNIGGSSLAQVALHVNTQTMSSGEAMFTFIAPAGGVSSQDLFRLRDIGNSILGGGNSLNYPTTDINKYPDGPDIMTVAVVPLGANASVTARMNWSEAQA
jgi:hypothetical protein